MDDRDDALRHIVDTARSHGLTIDDIADALRASAPESARRSAPRGVLVQVLAYLGGTFVFAGIGVFISLQWGDMNAASRIIVTLGSGLAAFVLALIAAQDHRYARAAAPLFLVAGALEPTGMLVAFDELGSGGDWQWAVLVTSAVVGVQFVAVFARLRQATPLFLTIACAATFLATALDLAGADETSIALVVGASVLLASVGLARTPYQGVTPPWYFVGAGLMMIGAFDLLVDSPLEVLFVAMAAGLVFLSVVQRSRTLLFVGTASILAYTGWFTSERFVDSVGWPLALIAFGLIMIALSAVAVRIDRTYVRDR